MRAPESCTALSCRLSRRVIARFIDPRLRRMPGWSASPLERIALNDYYIPERHFRCKFHVI
jgi:hypothetical protein